MLLKYNSNGFECKIRKTVRSAYSHVASESRAELTFPLALFALITNAPPTLSGPSSALHPSASTPRALHCTALRTIRRIRAVRCVQGLAGRVLTTGEIVNVVAGQVGPPPTYLRLSIPILRTVSADRACVWRKAQGAARRGDSTVCRSIPSGAAACAVQCSAALTGLLCAPLVACCAVLRCASTRLRIASLMSAPSAQSVVLC